MRGGAMPGSGSCPCRKTRCPMTTTATTKATRTVYTFPNGFARNAEAIYGWLRHYNLTPSWGDCSDGSMRIELSPSDAGCLVKMMKHNPARFGNPPEGDVFID